MSDYFSRLSPADQRRVKVDAWLWACTSAALGTLIAYAIFALIVRCSGG